jgi:hypothetical protein
MESAQVCMLEFIDAMSTNLVTEPNYGKQAFFGDEGFNGRGGIASPGTDVAICSLMEA